jgi:hypothetical protein
MDYKGHCWGYGNVKVADDYVCDSWASTDVKEHARSLWRSHRKALAREA